MTFGSELVNDDFMLSESVIELHCSCVSLTEAVYKQIQFEYEHALAAFYDTNNCIVLVICNLIKEIVSI